MTLGDTIRALRGPLTRREFAARVGCCVSASREWERNRAVPVPATAERLARMDRGGRFERAYPWTQPDTAARTVLIHITSDPGAWTRSELEDDLNLSKGTVSHAAWVLRRRGLITRACPYVPTPRGIAHVQALGLKVAA